MGRKFETNRMFCSQSVRDLIDKIWGMPCNEESYNIIVSEMRDFNAEEVGEFSVALCFIVLNSFIPPHLSSLKIPSEKDI